MQCTASYGLIISLILLNTRLSYSQEVSSGPPRPGGLVGLALRDSVAKELKIDTDFSKASAIRALGALISDELQANRHLAAGDRRNWQQLKQEIHRKHEAELKKLLTLEQYTRLKQISWQSDEAAALTDPEVIQAIGISTDQAKSIYDVTVDFGKKHSSKQTELIQEGKSKGLSVMGPEFFSPLVEIRLERDKCLQAILSKTQQEEFVRLKGATFKVPE